MPGRSRSFVADLSVGETFVEAVNRNLDMFMMAGWNARERSTKDFEGLFTLADAGFRFVGASTPPGSSMSIIEAVWE